MKTLNQLLVAAAAVVTLNMAFAARAGEPLLSPRAKANQIRVVPGSSAGVDTLKDRPIGNAKAWELAQSLRKVPSTGSSVDLAHARRPTLSPRDPRYDQELRRLQEVQVAPLK